jgi:putative alpha-1,2-mannosidase
MIAAGKQLMQKKLGIVLISLAVPSSALAPAARYIDPMLGVGGGGNTFPGPSLPFGMIKPGPDIGDNKGNAGWKAKGDINGFSQTHVNGSGADRNTEISSSSQPPASRVQVIMVRLERMSRPALDTIGLRSHDIGRA